MFAPSPEELQFKLLDPLARRRGLDYAQELLEPQASAAQSAFRFVSCGADLLLSMSYPDGFPAVSKRTRKRGAKALVRAIGEPGSQEAAVFLAQALGTLLAEKSVRAGRDEDAGIHRRFVELIQSHYTLEGDRLEALDHCRAEYLTFTTHEVRRDIRVGVELGTGYHRALLDPDFLDGRHPDEDEQMTEIQESYAGRFLRTMASRHALRMALGVDQWAKLEAEVRRPGMISYDSMAAELGDMAVWNHVAEDWFGFAKIAAGRSGPEQGPLAHPVAQALREPVEQLLEDPPRRMSEAVAQTASKLAHGMAEEETDWYVVTDALIMGYYLRRAERERGLYNELDADTIAKIVQIQRDDPEMGLPAGALTVAESLPAGFAYPPEVWYELRGWASREAIQRAWARLAVGIEGGGEPGIDEETCAKAFGYGYGLGFCEPLLVPEDEEVNT